MLVILVIFALIIISCCRFFKRKKYIGGAVAAVNSLVYLLFDIPDIFDVLVLNVFDQLALNTGLMQESGLQSGIAFFIIGRGDITFASVMSFLIISALLIAQSVIAIRSRDKINICITLSAMLLFWFRGLGMFYIIWSCISNDIIRTVVFG